MHRMHCCEPVPTDVRLRQAPTATIGLASTVLNGARDPKGASSGACVRQAQVTP
jgi:hypothetical protein